MNNLMMFIDSMANLLKDLEASLIPTNYTCLKPVAVKTTVLKCCSAFYHLGISVMSNLILFKETDF